MGRSGLRAEPDNLFILRQKTTGSLSDRHFFPSHYLFPVAIILTSPIIRVLTSRTTKRILRE
jgi:hypothetical protein